MHPGIQVSSLKSSKETKIGLLSTKNPADIDADHENAASILTRIMQTLFQITLKNT